jgi:hypothetical protein
MKTSVRLRVTDAAGAVARLRRTGETVVLEEAAPDVRADLGRWLSEGFVDQVGAPGRRQPRRTLPDDPLLLERIAERLRNYGYQVLFELVDAWDESTAMTSDTE